jgi:hypothetical protein
MLVNDINNELFAEWSDSITDERARAAFWYLIGVSACLEDYRCQIQWKGEVRDFRFYAENDEQPFSFITNQEWLLFYFRKPAIRSGRFSVQKLKDLFDSFNENSAGEWTVKIAGVSDAHLLARTLGWLPE